MDFLKYIEYDAENLQFFLWYKDYVKRFFSMPEHEQRLAPEWTPEQAQAEKKAMESEKPKRAGIDPAAVFKNSELEPPKPVMQENGHNPFSTPPRTPSANDRESLAPSTVGWEENGSTLNSGATDHTRKTAQAFEEANILQPFTVQPFREEISRIIAIYIADGGSRILNLADRERSLLLKALSVTTHPSAFREVISTVEWTLRHQGHPNFIRWTICNGNPPRQTFARGLGIGGIIGGLVYGIVITLSGASRGWRALAFLGFFIGISTLFAAWKGMCVVSFVDTAIRYYTDPLDRSYMACTIVISDPGNCSTTQTRP